VSRAKEAHGVSNRRACGLLGCGTSSFYYPCKGRGDEGLREALKEKAYEMPRWGYRILLELLRRVLPTLKVRRANARIQMQVGFVDIEHLFLRRSRIQQFFNVLENFTSSPHGDAQCRSGATTPTAPVAQHSTNVAQTPMHSSVLLTANPATPASTTNDANRNVWEHAQDHSARISLPRRSPSQAHEGCVDLAGHHDQGIRSGRACDTPSRAHTR